MASNFAFLEKEFETRDLYDTALQKLINNSTENIIYLKMK